MRIHWFLTLSSALALAFFVATAGSAARSSGTFSCTVTGVHDGDGPIYCTNGTKIRLHAIAAREIDTGGCRSGHPCPAASAESARAALRSLALGQTLSCVATGTSYDRVTAICDREDGRELNCEMVRQGYADRWHRFARETPICA
jgi:endonuclease YncB( thermonuclease family)